MSQTFFLLLPEQVRRKYRIAPSPTMMKGRKLKASHHEVRQKETLKEDRDDKSLAKFEVEAELAWMRNMTVQEAAAAAAQAIAEAEKAMAEAEEATREAEAAEADAEAAQAFAEAAMLTLKSRNATKLVVISLNFWTIDLVVISHNYSLKFNVFVPFVFTVV